MKVNKISKIISILFIITAVLSAVNMVFATGVGTGGVGIPTASQPSGTGVSSINNIVSGVIFIIQTIAFAAAVIMLIFVGIKFITASPEGKAEIKKTAVIYIVGAILLFAAGGILGIVKNLAENNIK